MSEVLLYSRTTTGTTLEHYGGPNPRSLRDPLSRSVSVSPTQVTPVHEHQTPYEEMRGGHVDLDPYQTLLSVFTHSH